MAQNCRREVTDLLGKDPKFCGNMRKNRTVLSTPKKEHRICTQTAH